MRKIVFLAAFFFFSLGYALAWANDSCEECPGGNGDWCIFHGSEVSDGECLAGEESDCDAALFEATQDTDTYVSCEDCYADGEGLDSAMAECICEGNIPDDCQTAGDGNVSNPDSRDGGKEAADRAADSRAADFLQRTREETASGAQHFTPTGDATRDHFSGITVAPGNYGYTPPSYPHTTQNKSPGAAPERSRSGGDSPNNPLAQKDRGDPINPFTGELILTRTDLEAPGISLTRTYRNQLAHDGPFGLGWIHNFSSYLYVADSSDELLRMGPGGYIETYTPHPENHCLFDSAKGKYARLTKTDCNSDREYKILYSDLTEETYQIHPSNPDIALLRSIVTRDGRRTALNYNAQGQLTEVVGPLGFKLRFEYNSGGIGAGKVKKVSVINPQGQAAVKWIDYTYEEQDPADRATLWVLHQAKRSPSDGALSGTAETYFYDKGHYSNRESAFPIHGVKDFCKNNCFNEVLPHGCQEGCATAVADCETDCRNDCEAGDPTEECDDECSDSDVCSGLCEDDECISECEDDTDQGCDKACDPVRGQCAELAQTCPTDCLQGATAEERRDANCQMECVDELFVYGVPGDLNGNLLQIKNNAGQMVLKAEYGADPHNISFDRVIHQQMKEDGPIYAALYSGVDPWEEDFAPDVHITDFAGNSTDYVYNDNGGIIKKTVQGPAGGALGYEWKYEYNANGEIKTMTWPNGRRAVYEYQGEETDSNKMGRQTNVLAQGNVRRVTLEPSPGNGVSDAPIHLDYDYYDEMNGLAPAPVYNQIKSVADFRGTTRFEYDARGNPRMIISPAISLDTGQTIFPVSQFDYNSSNQPIQFTDGKGNKVRYFYNPLSNPVGTTCNLSPGNDVGGLLRGVQYGANASQPQSTCFAYDANGRMTAQTGADGVARTFQYDARDLLKSVSDPLGLAANFYYDAFDNLWKTEKTTRDAASVMGPVQTTTLHTDPWGNLDNISQEKREGQNHDVILDYDGNQNVIGNRDPLFGMTTWNYGVYGQVSMETMSDDPTRGWSRYTHVDANSNIIGYTDALSHSLSAILYDGHDRIRQFTGFDGVTHIYSYYPDSRLQKHEWSYLGQTGGVRRAKAEYEYNALGWPTKITTTPLVGFEGVTAQTQLFYDANGNVTKVTDAKNYSTLYFYDEQNRLIKSSEKPDGQHVRETVNFYNNKGQLQFIKNVDWDGVNGRAITTTEERSYDELGRLKTIKAPDGGATKYSWDGLGNIIKVESPNGSVEETHKDGLGRPVAWSKKASGGVTESLNWNWNDTTHTVVMTDGKGGRTESHFDSRGRVDKVTRFSDSGSLVQTYSYDQESRVTGWVDAEGNRVTQEFDNAGRIIKRELKPVLLTVGTTLQRFAYQGNCLRYSFDNNDNSTASDDVAVTLDCDYRDNTIYDSINGHITTASRDARGAVDWLTYSSGTSYGLGYDPSGRLISTSRGRTPMVNYTYSGPNVGLVQYASTRDLMGYDAAGQLKTIEALSGNTNGARLASWEFTLNNMSLPEQIKGSVKFGTDMAQFMEGATYDGLGELKLATITKTGGTAAVQQQLPEAWLGKYEYTFDNNSNRTNQKYTGALSRNIDYVINQLSQYSKVGALTLDYDKNGNLIRKGDKEFRYDFLGRLRSVKYSRQTPVIPITIPTSGVSISR